MSNRRVLARNLERIGDEVEGGFSNEETGVDVSRRRDLFHHCKFSEGLEGVRAVTHMRGKARRRPRGNRNGKVRR